MKEYIKIVLVLALSPTYDYLYPMMPISASVTKSTLISQIGKIRPILKETSPTAIEYYKINVNKEKFQQLTDEITHTSKQAFPAGTWTCPISSCGMFRPNRILYSPNKNPNAENTKKEDDTSLIIAIIIAFGLTMLEAMDHKKFTDAGGKKIIIPGNQITEYNDLNMTKCPKTNYQIWNYIQKNYTKITPNTHKLYMVQKEKRGGKSKYWTGDYEVYILPINNTYETKNK